MSYKHLSRVTYCVYNTYSINIRCPHEKYHRWYHNCIKRRDNIMWYSVTVFVQQRQELQFFKNKVMLIQARYGNLSTWKSLKVLLNPKKMGNRGTRFLRKVCESEEGWDETPIFYLISSKSNSFGWVIQLEACYTHHWSHCKAEYWKNVMITIAITAFCINNCEEG